MELSDYSSRHGSFYAPAFVVRVANQELTEGLAMGVSQVEVDRVLKAAGRFSFTVVHCYSAEERAFVSGLGRRVLDILRFGAEIEIAVGYGDRKHLPTLISGVITEVTTGFSEGGTPELTVSGYDHLFPLTLGKRSRSWAQAADSDVVSQIAQEYSLAADIEPTREQHAQIEQNQESDFEFLKKLAERNYFEFYVDARKKLRFGPPQDRAEGIVTLRWGRSLLSFKPEANLAAQVASVEVYGWDPQRKQPIVGRAAAGEESGHDPRRQSGGERIRAALGVAPVLQVRQPVFTEAEARRRAEAILNDHAKRFLTGEADSIGLPDIVPDRNVTLADLGEPFSKTYYVHQTIHKVDTNGYRTRLKVREPSL